MRLKSIAWSDPQPPNNNIKSDHLIGVTPMGRFLITWTSWQPRPNYWLDEAPWGKWEGMFNTLEEAKETAWRKYFDHVEACFASE